MSMRLDRRNFVKLILTALSGFDLSPLIMGCTQNRAVPEARKPGAKKLESHRAIPTPGVGRYRAGTMISVTAFQATMLSG
jgi:hypothetical protein